MISDPSLRWLADEPQLDSPTLVVMLDGWIDAAGAAAAAMAAIHDEGESSPVVSFDDDTFLDYRARRPTMELPRRPQHRAEVGANQRFCGS